MRPKRQLAPLNILLAEDDSADRFFFEKALKEIPIATHLVKVQDGEELMNYLSGNLKYLPDVLFLDLSMPRKTGFECLSEIKENKKLKDIPVVVFTIAFPHDKGFEANIKNTLSAIGANEFISKTSDLTQLKQVIHNALIKATQKSWFRQGCL